MAKKRLTIAIDFDGVIHTYDGWKDGTCYGEPMPGCFKTITEWIAQGYDIIILSTRNAAQIKTWLDVHDAPFDSQVIDPEVYPPPFYEPKNRGLVGITNIKYAAVSYIDDRAIRFTTWRDVKNYYH